MRWARDVIAPLLVASSPHQAFCFSIQQPHLQSAISSAGWRWYSQHLPAHSRERQGTCFSAGGLSDCRKLHHEHQALTAVSTGCGPPPMMTASSSGGAVPMTTSAATVSVPPIATTRYTIDVGVHPDVSSLAVKHALRLPRFLEHYPISSHTKVAYGEAVAFVREFHRLHHGPSTSGAAGRQRHGEENQRHPLPVVLDSGCGTGRSSVLLAKSHPHLPVIGIDRSAVRLSKGGGGVRGREGPAQGRHRDELGGQEGAKEDSSDDEASLCSDIDEGRSQPRRGTGGDGGGRRGEPLPENLLLLRADLVDLWILASRDDAWKVREHFILYPNPYPKRSQLRSRWHGHPVFPVLLGLGGRITLRSNWKSYLDEVCQAVLAINDEARKAQESALTDGEGVDFGGQRVEVGSGRHGGEGLASSGLMLSGEDATGATNGELSADISRETVVDIIEADTSATDAAVTLPATEIPVVTAAAAASYAASARVGPSMFEPAVPASTNFEAKYVAVGESVYELRLEPQQGKSVEVAP